jgi:hypothetical protein
MQRTDLKWGYAYIKQKFCKSFLSGKLYTRESKQLGQWASCKYETVICLSKSSDKVRGFERLCDSFLLYPDHNYKFRTDSQIIINIFILFLF